MENAGKRQQLVGKLYWQRFTSPAYNVLVKARPY
jgi:hypothetical protein